MKGSIKMENGKTVGTCHPDYESEYYKHIEIINNLKKENAELKKSILGMVIWLFKDKGC